MSAVEVPAELIERAATALFGARYIQLAAELRALLPQPAPTCPNCGDKDSCHGGDGCEALLCDCRLSRAALPQVRALLDAERDSKPAQREPRMWLAGVGEPKRCDCPGAGSWGATGRMPAGHFLYSMPDRAASYLAHFDNLPAGAR